jgi:peptidoglycan/xylan/chitin deacetylase (PgdA/CDA1 family)
MKKYYRLLQRIWCYYKQSFTRQIKYVNNSFSKTIALTFDDGPHPVLTRQILELLKEYKIRATFFLSGPEIEKYPEIAGEIYNEGHCLGNHGYYHVLPEDIPPENMIEGFEKTDMLLSGISGKPMAGFYRPPYGREIKEFRKWYRNKSGYLVLWSLDSYDYLTRSDAEQLAEMLIRDVVNGDIILLHDTKGCTFDILKLIIPELLKQNYRFISIDEKIN